LKRLFLFENQVMKFFVSVAAAIIFSAVWAFAQEGRRRFSVVEYNCENMFDTIHQAGNADEEFTPQGTRKWDSRRYWLKLGKLARVLAACGEDRPVDLVALCEVENDSVLFDLTRRTGLNALGYEFLMTKGADVRGINMALLYQPLSFAPFFVERIRIPHFHTERPTRDLLHVSAQIVSGDTLDVIVCHLPSRSAGVRETDPYRRRVARMIRELAEKIYASRENPAIVITGDFNDELENASLSKVLKASSIRNFKVPGGRGARLELVDMTPSGGDGVEGTYKFRGEWNHLDHILVNAELLDGSFAFRTSGADCSIVRFPFLLETKGQGNLYPRRTFLGPVYHAGISDHLPLQLNFWFE